MSPPGKRIVSIVTVNLNNAAGLAKTLDSVAAQTFRDFEHIVIDGGSTDGSIELLRARADHLAYWVSEPDAGVYPAMNKGWRAARGEYVLFLNSGDWLASTSVVAAMLDGASEDIVYGDFLRPDGRGGTRYHSQPATMQLARYLDWGYCHQSIFYRRALLGRMGGYDERLSIVADWDLTVRALLAGCSTRHRDVAVAYYEAGGLSAANKDRIAAERQEFLDRLLPAAVLSELRRLRALERDQERLFARAPWLRSERQGGLLRRLASAIRAAYARAQAGDGGGNGAKP